MQIIEYKHLKATEHRSGYFAIPELDRYKSSVAQFIKLAGLRITLQSPTAFLYVDGFTISQAESGIGSTNNKFQVAIKTGSSYIAHEWIQTFQDNQYLKYMDVISSTCASGIHAIAEAERLLNIYDEVIIIGSERTTENTIRMFKELRIPVDCGDGFVYMRLQKGTEQVEDIKWKYAFNTNPFNFTQDSLNSLIPPYSVDYVKLHGTGSEANDAAEANLAEFAHPLRYKSQIGHTQGISALLETCIILSDDKVQGKILVTANGLGGFFGAFTLQK